MKRRAFITLLGGAAAGPLGWTAGRNLQIEYRWGGEIADRNREYAAELVALAPDVIVAGGSSPGLAALRRATRTIPIVFASIVDEVIE
jgi:putative ABC transport system substrate-binding protein